MDEGLQKLLSLAWRTVPAREANEAILKARAATAAGEEALQRGLPEDALDDAQAPAPEDLEPGALARSYELVLDPGETLQTFAERHLPKLVYHFESIGARLPHAGGVVICVFEGERLHFFVASEFLVEVMRQLSLTADELSARYGTHELRTAVRGTPLTLSGKPDRGDA